MEPTNPQRRTAGQFKPGPDQRRHRFTREECQAGFWAAVTSIVLRYPDAIDSSGRQPEARARLETALREEIERLVEEYKNRIEVVFAATWRMLKATETFIRF